MRGAATHGVSPDAPARVERLRRVSGSTAYPAPARLASHVDVAVVGGGQAGLAASWYLQRHGIEHLVLERDQIASSWKTQRWDAFCLVTPNWQCRLPEFPYPGDDREGFMVKDEIIDYVEAFAASFAPPLYEGVSVHRITRDGRSGFVLETNRGELRANQVVLAVGGYHRPALPEVASQPARPVTQLHSSSYRNPSSLPDGAVLVVGSGQSGAQIAEDLQWAGRDVHLSLGSAPRVARFYRGRDCVAWLEDIGHYDMPVRRAQGGPRSRPPRAQPLRHRPRRRPRHRPARPCPGRDEAARPAIEVATGNACSSLPTYASAWTRRTPRWRGSRTRSTSGSPSTGSKRRPRTGTRLSGSRRRARGQSSIWRPPASARSCGQPGFAATGPGSRSPASRATAIRATSAGSATPRACTCSASPGCGPGARDALPESPAMPST